MEYCPYCKKEIEIDPDGCGFYEGVKYEQKCAHCKKTFVYETTVIVEYKLCKAPCKNGGRHKFIESLGNLWCEHCGDFCY